MATTKQIKYMILRAKKKLVKANKELTATKIRIKKLESQLKKAQPATKPISKKKGKRSGRRTGGTGVRRR